MRTWWRAFRFSQRWLITFLPFVTKKDTGFDVPFVPTDQSVAGLCYVPNPPKEDFCTMSLSGSVERSDGKVNAQLRGHTRTFGLTFEGGAPMIRVNCTGGPKVLL